MGVVKLSQEMIDHQLVVEDGKKSIEAVDDQRTGLYVKVSNTSSVYYLRYKNLNGKTCHQKIARTDEISLAEARSRVKQLKADIAAGNDPREAAQAKKALPTFGEFFNESYLPHVKSRKRSWNKDESMFRVRLNDAFGSKKLNQITRREVVSFHTRLLEVDGLSPASCDHHLKLMRRMLNLAVEWEIIEKNPLSRIHLYKEDNKVENYLNEEQLRRLLQVLHNDKNRMTCMVMLFLLSTGARLNEALSAKWSQVDTENRVWVIPATNSKSKRIRSVPLNKSALDALDRTGTEGKFEHVFINHRTGNPLRSVHTGWKALREEAGLPHLRIHDLRHSFASMLVNNGRTLYEVQQILGHSVPIVTQRYAHLSSKTLQSASDAASNCIAEALVANA